MNSSYPIVAGFANNVMIVSENGYRYKNPCRQSNALMIAKSGRIRYFQGNKTFISDSDHVILIPQGADYSLVCDELSETYVINFFGAAVTDEILTFECREEFFEDAEFIISNFEGDASAYLAAMGRLYSILSALFENKKKIPKIIKRGVEFIEGNLFDCGLSVENAAAAAGVSEVYFRRVFRECFGISPLKFIGEKRIAHAKRLLAKDDLNLDLIANECGYSSIYSFSAAFKKKEGVSPSEYRKKYGEL